MINSIYGLPTEKIFVLETVGTVYRHSVLPVVPKCVTYVITQNSDTDRSHSHTC